MKMVQLLMVARSVSVPVLGREVSLFIGFLGGFLSFLN